MAPPTAPGGQTLRSVPFSLATTGTIVAAVPRRRIKVYAVKLVATRAVATHAVRVHFRDGFGAALEGSMPLPMNGGFVESVAPPAFLFGTSAGNALDLVIRGDGTVSGRVSVWDDDAT